MEKIIHQTWKDLDPPRDIYRQEWQDSWKRDYPDWEYKFWTDEDNENLVLQSYPEYFDFFQKIERGVIKSDMARLLYLHKFGGLYVDMDFLSLKPIDSILEKILHSEEGYNLVLGTHDNKLQPIPNAWMYAFNAGDPVFLKIIEDGISKNPKKVEAVFGPDRLEYFLRDNEVHFFALPLQSVYPAVWSKPKTFFSGDWNNIDELRKFYPRSFAVTPWRHNW